MGPTPILVIEDDNATQRILKMFLEKSGYAPVFAPNGALGIEEAMKDNAPSIILLDWMLPDMQGPDICKRLRAAKLRTRPYILFLSSRQDKADVAVALDSGADDYLGKPFNVGEAQARLRVAARTLEYQSELRRQIAENESLVQRNQLLQELLAKEETRQPFEAKRKPAAETLPPGRFSLQDSRFTLSAAFLEGRLAMEKVDVCTGSLSPEAFPWMGWSSFVLPSRHWIDVAIAASADDAISWFETSLRRAPHSPAEALGFLSELAHFAAQGFARAARKQHGGAQLLLPPRGANVFERPHKLPLLVQPDLFDIVVEGKRAQVVVSSTGDARKTVGIDRLKPWDIFATAFPPPQVSAVPLFKEGVVLNERFLEKLSNQVESGELGCEADVWRPSALASYFNPASEQRATVRI